MSALEEASASAESEYPTNESLSVKTVEKPGEVPQAQFIDRAGDAPVVTQRQMPMMAH